MSRHTRYELRKKCAKCNITAAEDRNLSFHSFPLPGKHTIIKARVWAEYCYPSGEWSTEKSLRDLQTQHKMLCSKHFDDTSFTSSARLRLNNFAIPIGTQHLLEKFRQEQCAKTASRSGQDTNVSVEKPQVLVTTETSLPVPVPTICEPITDSLKALVTTETSLPVQEPTICEPATDSPKVCRVCLAVDVKMYDLKDIELREMFQNITGIAVTEKNHSILERLCWECTGKLKTAAAFRKKALLSDALLQGLASSGEQISKNDINLIKANEDYLKSVGSLSVVEVFHTVDIDPDNDSVPPISMNNDTEIVENTVLNDSIKLEKESIIEEDNHQMDVEDESMIEAPITTEMEYDQIDPICLNTGDESSNNFLETNPVDTNNVAFKEDKINSVNNSPLACCSNVEHKYPIIGYLLKTPSDFEDKIKKTSSKELTSARLKNINVKTGGISKKTSNPKLVKKTKVKANTPTDEEYLSSERESFEC